MKNVKEILRELGIEIPADKEADFNKAMAENYKTIAEHEKKVEKMQKDLDNANARAEAAESTLKGFEGKDFDAIKAEADKWKGEYEGLIQKQKDEAEKAELDEAIDKAIKEAKGKNAKAIIAQLDMDAIKASKNRDKDIASAIKSLSESEETAFLFASDPEGNRAHFTQPGQKGKQTDVTRESILAMPDKFARIEAISQHRDLFPEFNK